MVALSIMNALDLSETDAMSNYTHQNQRNQQGLHSTRFTTAEVPSKPQGLHCRASGLTLQQAFPSKPLGLHRGKPCTAKDKYLQKGRGRCEGNLLCNHHLKDLAANGGYTWIEGRNPAGNGGYMGIEGRNFAGNGGFIGHDMEQQGLRAGNGKVWLVM